MSKKRLLDFNIQFFAEPQKWENDILGFVQKEDWLDVGFQVTRPNDPVDGIIGDVKTDNLVAKWQSIASEYQIPMMAQFHGFDTEAQRTFRVPVDTHNIEKGLVKVKINQSERMRQLIRSGVREDALYDYIINDGVRLADQVVTRSKVAKNELLATGKVTINENNLDLVVDYGVPDKQVNYTLDLSEDADISAQIQQIYDDALNVGVTLTGIYTSKYVINRMRNNKHLQTILNGNVGAGIQLRSSQVTDYLNDEFGITTVITNDLTYGASAEFGVDGRPHINSARYYPKNRITFFGTNPGGRLGTTIWGNPPEVDAARFFNVGTEPGVSPYVYVMQWMETDPTVLWTKASGLMMPVIFNPNSLFIATVADNFLNTPSVSPEDGAATVFGHTVSDLQTGVTVTGDKITGTLKYVNSGTLASDWGPGNFLVLKWSDIDPSATSLKVGLEPSMGAGMQEGIEDLDRNGVFKVTSKNTQKFKIVVSNAEHETVRTFDLSGLTVEGPA